MCVNTILVTPKEPHSRKSFNGRPAEGAATVQPNGEFRRLSPPCQYITLRAERLRIISAAALAVLRLIRAPLRKELETCAARRHRALCHMHDLVAPGQERLMCVLPMRSPDVGDVQARDLDQEPLAGWPVGADE